MCIYVSFLLAVSFFGSLYWPRFFVIFSFADIAQSAEHFLGKEEVTGSSPVISSKGFWLAFIFWLSSVWRFVNEHFIFF